MSAIIKVTDLSYEYPDEDENSERYAVKNINLEIERGSFVAVLGHNGSGKSTLAKLFNGILKPSAGTVLVDGIDTSDEENLIRIRQTVGMVFQNPDNQLVSTIVEDDVAFGPENLGVPPQEIRKRVDEALETVGMKEYALHAPHQLSGGQKQRIAIAGVLALCPECIIFDESTAMLDPVGRDEILGTIKHLNGEEKKTVILITHYMHEATLADRVIVMNDGIIEMDGTPKEVFSNYARLLEIGLDVPQVTELIESLREADIDLPRGVISIEEAVEILIGYFGKNKNE